MNPFTRSTHPYYMDPHFVEKLPLYKTAWSPTHNRYVGLKSTWRDSDGVPVIEAHVAGTPEGVTHRFRATELFNYVL